MSWLPIIICLAAVALFLGPIMLMQPTPTQRRQTQLRNCAAKRGLRVHLQPIPKGCDHTSGSNSQAVTYCLPWGDQDNIRNPWVLIKKSFHHDLHALGDWDWALEPGAARQTLLQNLEPRVSVLPACVYALSSGPQGLCCYWNELGREEDVDALADWLEQTAVLITLVTDAKPKFTETS